MLNNLLLAPQYPVLIGSVAVITLVVFDSRVQDLGLLYQALLPDSIGFTIHPQADDLETISGDFSR